MSIIKNCPSCDSIIEFDENKKEVKCPSCKRKYLVEKTTSKNGEVVYSLASKDTNSLNIIVGVILVIILLILVIGIIKIIFSSYNKEEESTYNNNLYSINDITNKEKEEINKNTLNEINKWNKNIELTSSKNLGFYLIKSNNISTLYDVYELDYKINNNIYKVYTGVEYNNVCNDNIMKGTYQVHGVTLSKEEANIWGYDSIEDFYDDIPLPENAKVEETSGLYKK